MNEYTHESLQNEDRLDLLEHLHWNVQKDSSLTGATVDQVRDRFKAWIESPKAKIEGALYKGYEFTHDSSGNKITYGPLFSGQWAPRYGYCIHFDAAALNSVITGLIIRPNTILRASTT